MSAVWYVFTCIHLSCLYLAGLLGPGPWLPLAHFPGKKSAKIWIRSGNYEWSMRGASQIYLKRESVVKKSSIMTLSLHYIGGEAH